MRHTPFSSVCSCLTRGLLFLAAVVCVHAQTTDSDVQRLQAQKDRAQLEADIAKAEKDKAEAEAAAFKARLGSLSTANLPQGTLKTDNVVIEGSYLAYMAANSAARVIANQIPCGVNIAFFSAKDLDGIQALDALKAQIPLISSGKEILVEPLELKRVSAAVLAEPSDELKKLYIFLPPQQVAFAAAPIFAGIDAGLSLLSLFKTDAEFHGVSVTADDLALQALVSKQWRELCGSKASKVIHPGYSYPPIETDIASNDLLNSLSGLSKDLAEASLMYQTLADRVQTPLAKAVDGLRKLVADYRDTVLLIPALEAKLKVAATPDGKKKIQDDLDSAKKHLTELTETARAQFDTTKKLPAPGKLPYSDTELGAFLDAYLADQLKVDIRVLALKALQTKMLEFVTALTKPDSNGVTPLLIMLRAQALKNAKTANANLLIARFVSAGGNNIIKRNILHSTLRFSGGVITEYLLVDNAGYVTTSGVVACYGGQLKEGDIGKTFKAQKGAMSCTESIPK